MNRNAADRAMNVGAVTLNYRLEGHGSECLVCIHGVGSSLLAWEPVVQRLKGDFTILTFDLRGHGASTLQKGFYDIDEMVDEVLGLAAGVGFESFNLAGFSLGGLIAQRLALRYPAKVARLILLSTVAGRNDEERARVAARLEALRTQERGSHYDASLSRWLTDAFQVNNPELVKQLRERNAQNDPECYASAYRVLAQSDFGAELHRLQCPTLIVTGSDDAGSNPRMARFMHDEIAGSELRILPGLRHSILTEAPDTVASMIQNFIMAQAGSEAAEVRDDR